MSITYTTGTTNPHTLHTTVPDSPQMEGSCGQFIHKNFLQFARSNNINICHIFHDESTLSQIPKVRRKFEFHSKLKQKVLHIPNIGVFFTSTNSVYCVSLDQTFMKLKIFLYVMYLIFVYLIRKILWMWRGKTYPHFRINSRDFIQKVYKS